MDVEAESGEEEEPDSREFRGRIRMATMMPSSPAVGGRGAEVAPPPPPVVLASVEEESMVDIIF